MFTIANVNFTYVYVKFCIFLVSGLHIQWYILHALQLHLQYSTATCELALLCVACLAWGLPDTWGLAWGLPDTSYNCLNTKLACVTITQQNSFEREERGGNTAKK